MNDSSDLMAMMDYYWDVPTVINKMEQDECKQKEDKNPVLRTGSNRPCSWIRKRAHKKKMVRKFLSMNPAYDYSNSTGMSTEPAIWLNSFLVDNNTCYDPMLTYCINPYYHVYLSTRGNLRIYHGSIAFEHGRFAMGHKNRNAKKKTNKILRRINSDEDMIHSSSVCKKLGKIPKDFIW